MSLKVRILLVAVAIGLIGAAPAGAQQPDSMVPQSMIIAPKTDPPFGYKVTPRQALDTVRGLDKVKNALAGHPRAHRYLTVPLGGRYRGTYAVTFIEDRKSVV